MKEKILFHIGINKLFHIKTKIVHVSFLTPLNYLNFFHIEP